MKLVNYLPICILFTLIHARMNTAALSFFSSLVFWFVFVYRERRTKFEAYLVNERRKMETFRLRETKEFLSLDELKEKCDMSDNFMDILKVCIVVGEHVV